VRRFNRSYTQRIGALEDSFLGLGLPLGATRLLFEIGVQPATVQALRLRLGLDSGYASRLLRRLEEGGPVEVAADPADRRRRVASLTAIGRQRWIELEARSDAKAKALLEPLTERQRARLAACLTEADLLVRAATVTFEEVDPACSAAREATGLYFAELRHRFDFDDAGLDSRYAVALRPPGGVFVLAVSDGEAVACGGVQTIGAGVGEIKRMSVRETWRGAGLGGRLLRHLEECARHLGNPVVRLDTNDTLTEALELPEPPLFFEFTPAPDENLPPAP